MNIGSISQYVKPRNCYVNISKGLSQYLQVMFKICHYCPLVFTNVCSMDHLVHIEIQGETGSQPVFLMQLAKVQSREFDGAADGLAWTIVLINDRYKRAQRASDGFAVCR